MTENAMVDLTKENSPTPDDFLQKHVERTPHCHFVKGQSGNPAGRAAGCRNKATRIAEALLDGMSRR